MQRQQMYVINPQHECATVGVTLCENISLNHRKLASMWVHCGWFETAESGRVCLALHNSMLLHSVKVFLASCRSGSASGCFWLDIIEA